MMTFEIAAVNMFPAITESGSITRKQAQEVCQVTGAPFQR